VLNGYVTNPTPTLTPTQTLSPTKIIKVIQKESTLEIDQMTCRQIDVWKRVKTGASSVLIFEIIVFFIF
jgi:hypothetical protein